LDSNDGALDGDGSELVQSVHAAGEQSGFDCRAIWDDQMAPEEEHTEWIWCTPDPVRDRGQLLKYKGGRDDSQ
jgi:hypothetical protein